MSPGSTVICDRSITRAPFACPWTCASGPTVLIRSPSIRMPTPDCGASDRPSISRPALMRIGGAGWAGRGTCAHAVVATASWAIRAKLGRIAVSLWGEANLLVTASLSSHSLGDSPTEATVAVRVTCHCGTSYELKDEFAGRLVKCPQCGRENRVPGVVPAAAVKPQADPVFDRDVFLLRQQLLRISEKYDVAADHGHLYGARPVGAHDGAPVEELSLQHRPQALVRESAGRHDAVRREGRLRDPLAPAPAPGAAVRPLADQLHHRAQRLGGCGGRVQPQVDAPRPLRAGSQGGPSPRAGPPRGARARRDARHRRAAANDERGKPIVITPGRESTT